MKVLILASLVALALARETVESISSSEESISHINKKPEKLENDKQQQKEDEHQDKMHALVQPQPLLYPYAAPIPYPVLPQSALPVAQPAVVLPGPQPEIVEVPNAKENVFSEHVMPFLKFPRMPIFEPQIPDLTDLKNSQLPLPLLQPFMPQAPRSLLQTPMLPPQAMVSLPQSKALPLPQQVLAFPPRAMPFPPRAMPMQALLLNQELLVDPTWEFTPGTQPISPVYNLQQN
ncbi:PREDICTED: beta-casein-like [Miniopterus natalensis]|uniref:beta-casein-like n=1 Tax=Miniopterus natalensis TaxID=291302 RepID=UPI0007A6FD51|nr:PREDICTED: beta-casein-like [Miniopterus natalensis]